MRALTCRSLRRQAVDGPAGAVCDVVPIVAALARPSCGSIEQHCGWEGYWAGCHLRRQCSAMVAVVTRRCSSRTEAVEQEPCLDTSTQSTVGLAHTDEMRAGQCSVCFVAEWCLTGGIHRNASQRKQRRCSMGYGGPNCNSDISVETDVAGELMGKGSSRNRN